MDSRIIMLIMSVATFIAYPFLSGDGRKQVAPLAAQMDETEDQEETDDEDQPVMMEDDEPNNDGDDQQMNGEE